MKRIEAVNDFVIKFANVNGSGSASANELFARAILRIGVPVSPRNIFPSNIQVCRRRTRCASTKPVYQGRRGGVDLMVAMNPQTWDADMKEIETGGISSTTTPSATAEIQVPRRCHHVVGMPALTEICNADLQRSASAAAASQTSFTSARCRCAARHRSDRISSACSPSNTKARKRCCNQT